MNALHYGRALNGIVTREVPAAVRVLLRRPS